MAAAGAKLMPVRVTLAETEATLYGDDDVRTGPVQIMLQRQSKHVSNFKTLYAKAYVSVYHRS